MGRGTVRGLQSGHENTVLAVHGLPCSRQKRGEGDVVTTIFFCQFGGCGCSWNQFTQAHQVGFKRQALERAWNKRSGLLTRQALGNDISC